MARNLMEPDPEGGRPSLVFFLWLIALVLAFVLALALSAPTA
jgi:hypothetical protein